MIVKYLDGDYQHVVARVRDGQCVSKYNNMVMSDIFWRITRHVNIPPLATRAPDPSSVDPPSLRPPFSSFFFFFATTSFSRLQEISRASLGVLATAEFVLCTRSPLPRGLFNGRHFQADSLARTPLKGLLPGVKSPMLSLLHGLRKWHSVESAFPMNISFLPSNLHNVSTNYLATSV